MVTDVVIWYQLGFISLLSEFPVTSQFPVVTVFEQMVKSLLNDNDITDFEIRMDKNVKKFNTSDFRIQRKY